MRFRTTTTLQVHSDKPFRVLVVRPDRLGDVILSTPVFSVLKQHEPDCHITCFVRENLVCLLKGLSSIHTVWVFDPAGVHSGLKGFLKLCTQIRQQRFHVALVLSSHWKIALALWLAGVPERIGPLSKLHSFFLYNRGVRQRRSQVEMHEADYNLQLLRVLGMRVKTRTVPVSVAIELDVKRQARQWLEAQSWKSQDPLVLIHPGMGGSALNWPESHYLDLIRFLLKSNKQVLLTAGLAETALMHRLLENLGPLKRQVFSYQNVKGRGVDFLGALCELVDVVVAPSTGPLHLAVALQRRVVTFYPPIRVQSALRWGPYLLDESRASVLVPENYCGQDFKCLGSLCHYFPCMKSLTVNQTMIQIEKQLQLALRERALTS